MSNANIRYLLSFLVFMKLFHLVRTGEQNITKEMPETSYGVTLGETTNDTTDIMVAEIFHRTDARILLPKGLTLDELEKNKYKTEVLIPRKSKRDVVNGTSTLGLECLTCYGNSSSKEADNCYDASANELIFKKCADAEHCFTEINPSYIKRGCILPGRVNRTFICKCPLCNDKPSFDMSNYEYKTFADWEYDNARLQMPLSGMDLMCKVCETKGTNPASDKTCRWGKNADYMICSHNHLCYTNIDDETDFVSRGCIAEPLHNSIHFFCNNSKCNTGKILNPWKKTLFRVDEIKLKDDRLPKRNTRPSSMAYKTHTVDFILVLLILLNKIFFDSLP